MKAEERAERVLSAYGIHSHGGNHPMISFLVRAFEAVRLEAVAAENYECAQVAERYGDPEIRDAITDRMTEARCEGE